MFSNLINQTPENANYMDGHYLVSDKEGNVYTLARFNHDGQEIEDKVKIPNLFLRD